MTDLDKLEQRTKDAAIEGLHTGMTCSVEEVLRCVPALIAEARALRATQNRGGCPEKRCPCYVGCGDDPHPCTLCGAMRATDAKLKETFE